MSQHDIVVKVLNLDEETQVHLEAYWATMKMEHFLLLSQAALQSYSSGNKIRRDTHVFHSEFSEKLWNINTCKMALS